MIKASICTIGDEILIGQVIDTNSSHIATALEEAGIQVTRLLSIGDDQEGIRLNLQRELSENEIVITTGGLGPTKDDITKRVLSDLTGSSRMVTHEGQLAIVHRILQSRGLDILPSNLAQASVPDTCEVIPNPLGTAPVMVFRLEGKRTLYALPGVPHEAIGMLRAVLDDIQAHYELGTITHRSLMVYGMAESALAELIASWEDSLPPDMHLAYLPNPLTGIRLRLSIYSGISDEDNQRRMLVEIEKLSHILGNWIYSLQDDTLQETVGRILKEHHKTLSVAESCTGGEISHLITTVEGSSAYYLGSVTSYAIPVKETVLGVPTEIIQEKGVVSSEVAAAMAEGVRRLTGSDYAVATTGLAGPGGDEQNPVGTVWIGVTGPHGTFTEKRNYQNDRKRNIQRFAASALDFLRRYILEDLGDLEK